MKTSPPTAKPTGVRVIKKYPNRRLYDTQTSAYVTLAQVKALVHAGTAFQVLDAKTNDDLTRSILLQIILEAESGGVALFSETALTNLIRFYGHDMQGVFGAHLEQNLQLMFDAQARMAQSIAATASSAGVGLPGVLGSYALGSATAVREIQNHMQAQTEQLLRAFGLKR